MSPFLVQNHAISIGAYPFFYGLGLVCAGIVQGLLLSQRGLRFRDGIRIWGTLCLLIVFGGRLLYLMIYLPSQHLSLGWFLSLNQGGEVLYGALIFGTLGGCLIGYLRHWPLKEVLDASAVGAPLGISIGRIGCLLKGCCHGGHCDWWCGIRYPKVFDIYGNLIGSAAYIEQLNAHEIPPSAIWSQPVHPVPVYESIVCLALAAVMFVLWRRRILTGRLVFVFGGTYAIWRFTVEFIRVHERMGGLITIYQAISIGVLIACLIACFVLKTSSAPIEQRRVAIPTKRFWARSKVARKRK